MISFEEAKKELREYRDNIKYIDERQLDAEELKARILNISAKLSDMPSGKGSNPEKAPLEETLDKLKEIEKDCNNKLQELLIKKFVVENKIEQLEQPYKSILYLKYIRGMKLPVIANELNYSYGHVKNMSKEALEKYAIL